MFRSTSNNHSSDRRAAENFYKKMSETKCEAEREELILSLFQSENKKLNDAYLNLLMEKLTAFKDDGRKIASKIQSFVATIPSEEDRKKIDSFFTLIVSELTLPQEKISKELNISKEKMEDFKKIFQELVAFSLNSIKIDDALKFYKETLEKSLTQRQEERSVFSYCNVI